MPVAFDITLILPLIGVAIGWLLNEMGAVLNARRDERKIIGKVILKLLELHTAIFRLQETIHLYQRLSESRQFSDEERASLLETPLINPDVFLKDVDLLLADIATVDPLLATDIGERLRRLPYLLKSKSSSILSANVQDEGLDKFDVQQAENATAMTEKDIRELIFKLLRRKSWVQWLKAKKYFRVRLDYKKIGDLKMEMSEKIKEVEALAAQKARRKAVKE